MSARVAALRGVTEVGEGVDALVLTWHGGRSPTEHVVAMLSGGHACGTEEEAEHIAETHPLLTSKQLGDAEQRAIATLHALVEEHSE